jgi:outer membrane lipoprotein carrier protein
MRPGLRLLPLLTLLACLGVRADPLADLRDRLEPLQSLSSAFHQVVKSAEGETLEESDGRMALLRPDYFMWHIQVPDEQLLLAAGSVLWHYDVTLETATRRRLDPGNPTNPLTILGGDLATLGEHYRVEAIAENAWRLQPRFENPDFTAVEIFFESGLPTSMTVTDPLLRQTTITFSQIEANPPLKPADFEFTPPPGIDVYRNDS